MTDNAEALAALKAGITEASRRSFGEFDGLLGSFPKGVSVLLTDILDELRWVLLEKYSEEDARSLLLEYAPQSGYRHLTPVTEEIDLVLRLLNLVASATRCEGDRFLQLVLGPSGLRDTKRQAGTRRPRRPDVDEWILKHLRRDFSAKAPALWATAPESITDNIGPGRFAKRVTAARKLLKADASK